MNCCICSQRYVLQLARNASINFLVCIIFMFCNLHEAYAKAMAEFFCRNSENRPFSLPWQRFSATAEFRRKAAMLENCKNAVMAEFHLKNHKHILQTRINCKNQKHHCFDINYKCILFAFEENQLVTPPVLATV